MSERTCSIDGCDRFVGAKGAKGLCPMHYQAHRLAVAAPPCSVDGCAKRAHSRGLCPMHYQRQRLRGDIGTAEMERVPNVGTCTVEGCDQPMRKREWCASHYAQWCRYGDVRPFRYKWATEKRCIVCGITEWDGTGRKVCSPACQQMLRRMTIPGLATTVRPAHQTRECNRCGALIDLMKRGKSGRRKNSNTLICDVCRRAKSTRHGISVAVLHRRDGDLCNICGERIDMTLTSPDLFRASVDHVVPYALGGPHTLENTQLAHLWCNQVKHTREGFTI